MIQPVFAQDEDILDHPGYVDFSTLSSIAGEEPNVEISLKEPLLNLITNILKNNDEQAADFISTLLRVNVRVFESSMVDVDRIACFGVESGGVVNGGLHLRCHKTPPH